MSGAQLTLLYVEEKWYGAEGMATNSSQWQQIREAWIKEGQDILDREVARFSKLDVKNLRTELRQGNIADELLPLRKKIVLT